MWAHTLYSTLLSKLACRDVAACLATRNSPYVILQGSSLPMPSHKSPHQVVSRRASSDYETTVITMPPPSPVPVPVPLPTTLSVLMPVPAPPSVKRYPRQSITTPYPERLTHAPGRAHIPDHWQADGRCPWTALLHLRFRWCLWAC